MNTVFDMLQSWGISRQWTLFLDRDGVINRKIEQGYVLRYADFEFLDDSPLAIARLGQFFGRIVGITNQQCVGKKMLLETDLQALLSDMLRDIAKAGGKIDCFYYCPHLQQDNCACRKPNTGMGLQAKSDFPDIDFTQSVMVGDSVSDMQFARKLGMKTVFITGNDNSYFPYHHRSLIDLQCGALSDLAAIFEEWQSIK